MRYVPYMTIDGMEIVHSIPYKGDEADLAGNTGDVYVHFEKPMGSTLKSAVIDMNKLSIIANNGFLNDELLQLIIFVKNNRPLIEKMVQIGGIANA